MAAMSRSQLKMLCPDICGDEFHAFLGDERFFAKLAMGYALAIA